MDTVTEKNKIIVNIDKNDVEKKEDYNHILWLTGC